MAAGLERRDDHWRLPCEGLKVGQVRIDFAFGLEFTETPDRAAEVAWRLRINVPFTLRSSDGSNRELDPEGPAELLGPALVLRHQQLIEGNVSADGRIELRFGDEPPSTRHRTRNTKPGHSRPTPSTASPSRSSRR